MGIVMGLVFCCDVYVVLSLFLFFRKCVRLRQESRRTKDRSAFATMHDPQRLLGKSPLKCPAWHPREATTPSIQKRVQAKRQSTVHWGLNDTHRVKI